MKEWILIALIVYVAFEIIEHLGLPLFWIVRNRKRAAACGPDAMLGQPCRVKQWQGLQGKVLYNSELWRAECTTPLTPGTEARIVEIQGLTLIVAPSVTPDPVARGAKPHF